jgi:hypothetical protein
MAHVVPCIQSYKKVGIRFIFTKKKKKKKLIITVSTIN